MKDTFSLKIDYRKSDPDEGMPLTAKTNSQAKDFDIPVGSTAYIFCDKSPDAKFDARLIGRATIMKSEHVSGAWHFEIVFDGSAVTTPLRLSDLDAFKGLSGRNPLTDLSVVRSSTTHRVHRLSAQAAAWLNIYHLEAHREYGG